MRNVFKAVSVFLALASATLSTAAAIAQPQSSRVYLRIPLPGGVSVELPRNWTAISGHSRTTLEAAVEAMTNDPDTPNSILPFAANLYDDSKKTIAIFNVRYYPDFDIGQPDVSELSQADLLAIDAVMRAELSSALSKSGLRIVAWNGTSARRIGGKVALVTDYRRVRIGETTPFRVRLVRFLDDKKSFTATVSYKENLSVLLNPVTDHIVESIQIAR